MSDQDTQQPEGGWVEPRFTITTAHTAFFFVAVIAVLIVVGWMNSGPDQDAPTSEERLCALLQTGGDTNSLVFSDAWREWPEHYSVSTRERIVRTSARIGGCGNLVSQR